MQAEQFALHAQAEQRHWWFLARRSILRALLAEVLPPQAGHLVVDVGCGTGGTIGHLADDYRGVGIDPSTDAIQQARLTYPKPQFLCGAAPADLGPLAAEADGFLLTDVLEHVPDDFALLSQLLSAAKPGAYFLITVPAAEALWSQHDVGHAHYRRYDLERLRRVWTDLAVDELLLSYFNARLYPLVANVRAWNRWRGQASGPSETDLVQPIAPLNWLLQQVFAGERAGLVRSLRAGLSTGRAHSSCHRRGVSLIAVLRRGPDAIVVRQRPVDVPPDIHGPEIDGPPQVAAGRPSSSVSSE